MIIAVTGWRFHTGTRFIMYHLNHYQAWCSEHNVPMHVRGGDARGADAIVRDWCRDNEPLITWHIFFADWNSRGKQAGPDRNKEMLEGVGDPHPGKADLLLGFPPYGLKAPSQVPGSGTWGCMIIAAEQVGVEVRIPPRRGEMR